MTSHLKDFAPSIVSRRASFEGCNIRTWIGFKHLLYLMEEAVLEHFRTLKLEPSRLYNEHGLCLEIVYSGARIHHALHLDDVARIEVTPDKHSEGPELAFHIQMFVEGVHRPIKILSGDLRVLFRQDRTATGVPETLSRHVVSEICRPSLEPAVPIPEWALDPHSDAEMVPAQPNEVIWRKEIPYFYCHFSERLQHSGYLRLLEEAVARFLSRRGISIATMLRERQWIPFVSQVDLAILREVSMEETLYTVLSLEKVYKNLTYSARVNFFVARDGALLHTATGRITHGYGLSQRNLVMVNLDEQTIEALRGSLRHEN